MHILHTYEYFVLIYKLRLHSNLFRTIILVRVSKRTFCVYYSNAPEGEQLQN